MRRVVRILVVCALFSASVAAVSKPHSDKKAGDPISVPHDVDGVHNPKYDQEAIFGSDAKRLDDMTPEQRLEQLRLIFKKMDENSDGIVTREELRTWLRKMQQRLTLSDTKRIWEEHELKLGEKLSWEKYTKLSIGEDGSYENDDDRTRETKLKRDKRRWDMADEDNDGMLTFEEAVVFFNPEYDPKMHDTLVQETIEEMDKNHDGKIDVNEYLADIWEPTDDEQEPEWVAHERREFAITRDTNHDGKLDADEIRAWRFPSDDDYVEAEVKHLFSQCDTDRNGHLTESEVENQYDLFVGSAATNYGEALTDHDEL